MNEKSKIGNGKIHQKVPRGSRDDDYDNDDDDDFVLAERSDMRKGGRKTHEKTFQRVKIRCGKTERKSHAHLQLEIAIPTSSRTPKIVDDVDQLSQGVLSLPENR